MGGALGEGGLGLRAYPSPLDASAVSNVWDRSDPGYWEDGWGGDGRGEKGKGGEGD